MLSRIARGWGMARASWAVIKRHPRLLLFPVFSGLAFLALLAAMAVSAFTGTSLIPGIGLREIVQPDRHLIWVLLLSLYFVATVIVVFFNAGLVFCALESFAGREPTLRGGIAAAGRRLPQILAWSLVATTIGLLLEALQSLLKDRLGFLGALLGFVAEASWALVTYFVVPVLVVDGVGPLEAIRRSSAILKRTWGEAVGGEGGLGLMMLLFLAPALLALAGFGAAGSSSPEAAAVAAALVVLAAVYTVAVVVVFTALGAVFRASAYVYATTGTAPSGMDRALLQATFRRR